MSDGVSTHADVGLIVEELRQMHDGGAWHGPSLAEVLEGVSAEEAARRPIGAGHCIREIVHHLRVNDELVRRHLTGERPRDEAGWPVLAGTGEADWRHEVQQLRASQRALRDAVARLPLERLHENVPG